MKVSVRNNSRDTEGRGVEGEKDGEIKADWVIRGRATQSDLAPLIHGTGCLTRYSYIHTHASTHTHCGHTQSDYLDTASFCRHTITSRKQAFIDTTILDFP